MQISKLFLAVLTIGIVQVGILATAEQMDLNSPLDCSGVKAAFSLIAPEGTPSFDQIAEMPYLTKKSNEAVYPGKTNPQIRLEVCQKEGSESFELQRVVKSDRWASSGPAVFRADKGQILKNTGLNQALLGDVSNLEIWLVEESENLDNPQSAEIVKGMSNGLVGAVKLYKPDGSNWSPSEMAVLVGTLAVGDPFSNLQCNLGQQVLKSKVAMGTAIFEFEGCGYMGGGETTGYDITSISVTDSNQKIAPELQGKTFKFTGETLKSALAYKWNHHNGCDSFFLKVSETNTTYGATTAGAAGCGQAVPGAPQRTFNDKDYFVKYLIQYGANTVKGMTTAPHYMWTFGN